MYEIAINILFFVEEFEQREFAFMLETHGVSVWTLLEVNFILFRNNIERKLKFYLKVGGTTISQVVNTTVLGFIIHENINLKRSL